MTQSNQEARERMVVGAADMIRRRGLNATSVRELAKHSGAPLGSTYHYFPGGKQQLASEAVQFAGDAIARGLRRRLQAGPVEGVRAFLDLWRETVIDTDFRAGCPVLAVTVEEGGEDATAALAAAAEAFTTWESLLADSLEEHGSQRQQAEQIATLIVAAVEGTVAMCRAKRSTEPIDSVSHHLEELIKTALVGGPAPIADT